MGTSVGEAKPCPFARPALRAHTHMHTHTRTHRHSDGNKCRLVCGRAIKSLGVGLEGIVWLHPSVGGILQVRSASTQQAQ